MENKEKRKLYLRALYIKQAESRKISQRIWRLKNPGWAVAYWRKIYGRCKICNVHQKELKHQLGVDHNHTTGKVRGLLCGSCNKGLGLFKDSIELLLKASYYLEDTK
mgnify:CR=1 FL=1